MSSTFYIILVIAIVAILVLLISYIKAPPSVAYIVSGLNRKPRIYIGKGGLRVPLLERLDKVFLGQVTADIKTSRSVPTNDFINSLYWLTEKPQNGIDDADAQANFDAAIAAGAKFGFSIGGIKQSFITGAARGGLDVRMTELRGAFFLEGNTEASNFDFAEIVGPAPVMREDMVKVGGMSKTADIRYRGEFKEWEIPLKMRINKNGKYSIEQILNCVTMGGFVTGIGEWRPERDGQFGMFHLEI